MTTEQAQRLDSWLAAREATGERFASGALCDVRTGRRCVQGELLHDLGIPDRSLRAYEVCGVLGFDWQAWNRRLASLRERLTQHYGLTAKQCDFLGVANNNSDGSPAAVRAALHALCPFLTETPTEVLTT